MRSFYDLSLNLMFTFCMCVRPIVVHFILLLLDVILFCFFWFTSQKYINSLGLGLRLEISNRGNVYDLVNNHNVDNACSNWGDGKP